MSVTARWVGRIALALTAAPALAAGGAHVDDDAAVETPGKCHCYLDGQTPAALTFGVTLRR